MLFMLDMKVCLRGGRDRMRKLSVILVGMMASLLLAHLAWPGEIEVLYEGQWKILKTELVSGREYVPLAQVAKITGGGVLRDGLRVNGVTFRLQEEGKAQLSLRIEGGILSPMLSEAVRINDGVVEMVEPTQGQGEAIFRIQRDAFGGLTRTFTLNNPERIVVDLYRVKTAAQPPPETPPAPPSSRAPSAAPATPQVTGLRTIAIDPGHGGRDTGAIGPKGLQEKDVVLDIGLKLRRLIQERLGIRVVMTRPEDVFVPLEERTAIANRAKADFFISVHVT